MSLTYRSEALTLFRAWMRGPLKVGCMLPSSRAMGRAFAKLLDHDRRGDVLELGSGTGAITQGLIDGGAPAERLILVEREPDMAAHLRRRFPDSRIIEGDAVEVCASLERFGAGRLAAVVSSLPIVWFPLRDQAAIVGRCMEALGTDGGFLQMTNFPTSPLRMAELGISGTRVGPIWRNLPPSFIWRYAPGPVRTPSP